jgi:biotin-[acetyl-CoA-carboxylase] ligase BirA-like protein
MDALKKAEEAKRQSEAAAKAEPHGQPPAEAQAAAGAEPQGLPELPSRLELLDHEFHAAPAAKVEPTIAAGPPPRQPAEEAQKRERAAAQNVFQAKQPAPRRMFPLVVGGVGLLAAADALGPDARIKWPNDVLIGDRKVVGILCEMSADQEHVAWAVAGIGVNVAATPHLEDARWRAGALNESGVRRARGDVLVDLLNALGERYSDWIADGPDAVLAEFTRRDALAGRYVEASVGREVVTGVCTGLDPLGRLVLRDGEITRTLASGEVTRVRGIPGADT